MRIEQLTFTRFIAAISIVIYHFGKDIPLFNNQYVSFIFRQANIGVSYFFVLSGFVMIIAYHKKKTISFFEYLKNRFARVYPAYFFAIVLTLLLYLSKGINFYDLFLNIVMIQAWFPNKALTINYPGWSLSVELFFYISFPFLFNYFYKNGYQKRLGFIIVFFWLLSQFLFHLLLYNDSFIIPPFGKDDIYYNPLMHFNEFLVGNLAGLYFIKKLKHKTGNYSIYILILILIIVMLLKFPFGLFFHNGLLSIIFIPLIIFVSLNRGKLNTVLNKKPLIFLGEISFGIYILQRPVWKIISSKLLKLLFGLNEQEDVVMCFIIRFLILILISSLSYLYFEKTIRNKIKNLKIT